MSSALQVRLSKPLVRITGWNSGTMLRRKTVPKPFVPPFNVVP